MKASLGLRSEGAELGRLVGFAEEFARCHGLPEAERARLLIILEELFTNAVNYGYSEGGAAAGRIEVGLAVKKGRLQIDFSDDGRPFDPLSHTPPELDRPPTDRPVGGLGLLLLRSLVDEARYRRDRGRNHLALIRILAPALLRRSGAPRSLERFPNR
jgi:anti-sigma regulatory factor (Ser/Thr protein kinase)